MRHQITRPLTRAARIGPALASALLVLALALPIQAADLTVTAQPVTEWKSVFGRIEARNTVPARSRIGGTLQTVDVTEGSVVTPGQQIATIHDAKLELQLQSVQAQIEALASQLDNARSELERGESLLERGVTTVQRLDGLRTQVSVLENQIEAQQAQKRVIEQQMSEGAVLAPIGGRVIAVPVTTGSVVLPGEAVATIGGGGFFLRLAVPERHVAQLREGMEIQIGDAEETRTGHLAKVYPQIENGRVVADVEVEGLSSDFVNARVLVRLPVASRHALVIPAEAVTTRMGLDFVTVRGADGAPVQRAIVAGQRHAGEAGELVEILSGLTEGDVLVTGHE